MVSSSRVTYAAASRAHREHVKQHAAQPPSVLYAVGSHACSVAKQSIHETKDNFLLVCIGFLEALDRLQVRLHLPVTLVKELKWKLSKMVDRSLIRPVTAPTYEKLKQASLLGTLITENEAWGEVAAKPEEVRGFVQWLLAVMKSFNDLVVAGTVGICRRIFILIMNFPGMPTACSLFCRMFEIIEHALHLTSRMDTETTLLSRKNSKTSNSTSQFPLQREAYMGDPSLTAVVLEYREKECMVPMNINRRIQRVMHYQIPLRSFEATVRLPPDHQELAEFRDYSNPQGTYSSVTSYTLSSTSPRSIPVSPSARKKYQLAFSNFSDDVLFQARDRLRQERAVTLTGDQDLQIPRFNIQDCNEEIYLSCGRHCAVKEGTGMYRSVRTTVPIQRNRYVYFEMTLCQSSIFEGNGAATSNKSTVDIENDMGLSACIGLSTRAMPLNTLVGTARYSVGLYSGGHVLVGGQHRNLYSVTFGYGIPSTVGVLVYIQDDIMDDEDQTNGTSHVVVRFSVNGVPVRDAGNAVLVVLFPLPARTELFPTLSLHTQHIKVDGHFSAPDVMNFNAHAFDLPQYDELRDDIWCLDGLRLTSVSSNSVGSKTS